MTTVHDSLLPRRGRAALQLITSYRAWRLRVRSRRALERLSDGQLHDVGLERTPFGFRRSACLGVRSFKASKTLAREWQLHGWR